MGWLAPRPSAGGRHVVLYDGDCGLCDRSVRFLLRRDRGRALAFATLAGATGSELRERLGVSPELDSMLFVRDAGTDGERLLARSSAVLAALDAIGGVWRLVAALRWLPRPLRDAVYDFIARRRIAWFGRPDVCVVPGPGDRERFLP